MATAPIATPTDAGRDLEPMGKMKSLAISVLTWALPSLALFFIGLAVGSPFDRAIGFGLGLPILWSLFFIGAGIRSVEHNCFELYQRFGKFHSVKFGGLNWVNFVFDRKVFSETLLARSHKVYESENEAEFDFLNGSAPVDAVVWYSIVDPTAVAAQDEATLTRQIARWHYRFHQPESRVANIVDGELRPRLQGLTVNEAQINGRAACDEASRVAAPIMARLGAYLSEPEGIIVKDIDLPANLQELRQKEFEGQMQALAAQARLAGPTQAAIQVMKIAEKAGITVTFAEAQKFVNENQFIEAIKEGANVTLLGSTITDFMNAMKTRI